MAASTDDSVHESSELQLQLEEKDQLVLALTERLEEAAEQLDRVHRSGADKGGRVTAAGLSSDALSQQQTLIEQLGKSAEIWEDVQPREAFARIEARLEDLHGLLENGAAGRSSAGTSRSPSPLTAPPVKISEPPKREKTQSSNKPEGDESLSAWEKMKAELMGADTGDASAPANNAPSTTPAEPSHAPTSQTSEPQHPPAVEPCGNAELEPLSEFQLPEPINVDTANRSELADGVEVRDQYINYLTRRLRSAENRTHQAIDWAVLNNAPEELRKALQQLEADLVDRLRIAEVDLSLERARLGRVDTRVRGMQKQIEKRLQSVAGKGPSKSTAKPDGAKDGKKSKGWFGTRGR